MCKEQPKCSSPMLYKLGLPHLHLSSPQTDCSKGPELISYEEGMQRNISRSTMLMEQAQQMSGNQLIS